MNSKHEIHILFSNKEIESRVKELAAEISEDYRGKHPLLLGVLKGSFVFMADLVRHLDFPLEVEFVILSSYGRGRSTPGEIKLIQDLHCAFKGRDILVVEDIVDTGLTTAFLFEYLRKREPASLKLCSLTDKPSRRQTPVTIDYLGFTVPNKFIVGYGIDWDEKYRNLPHICYIELDE